MNHQESVLVRRPPSVVFDYMDNLDREVEWQPDLVRWSKEPLGPTAVGTKKEYVSEFLGREVSNTYVAKVWEPNRRVVYETTRDSSIRVTTEITFELEGDATRVTMTVDGKPTGFLKFIPKALLESTSRTALQQSLDRLKARLESSS